MFVIYVECISYQCGVLVINVVCIFYVYGVYLLSIHCVFVIYVGLFVIYLVCIFFYAVCVCYVCWVYHPSFTTGIATDVLILGLVNVGNGRQGGSGALTDQSAFAVRYDDVAT